jgi:hypothetical protein
MDQTRITELGDKLVWHSKGPIETAFKYNRYVVNGKLFRTVAQDEGKTTQNSGVCVPTVDGDTYYGKLTRIIEVEYYLRKLTRLGMCYLSVIGRTLERIRDGRKMSMV